MSFDVIVVGGGHNGLVCASYLAMGGKKVCVLEKNNIVGGAAVTDEFFPGFRNSIGSYTVSLLNPKIIKDLELHDHGLDIIERDVNNFWPHPDGNFLAFLRDAKEMEAEIAQFSEHDSQQLPRFYRDIEMVADVIRENLLITPPNAGSGIFELFKLAKIGNQLRKLSIEDERIVMDIFTKSVAEFLAYYFEDDRVRAAFAFDGVVGSYADTQQPGTAYILIHHALGEVNGKKGVWGHAKGGMGAITKAMASFATSKGVEIRLDQCVEKIVIENNQAMGVSLANGEILKAKTIVSNLNPSLLFSSLIENSELPEEFSKRISHYKNGSGTFRMNVALKGLPKFTALENQSRATTGHLSAGIVIGPSMDYLDKSFSDAKEFGWSKHPIVEMLIPSVVDDSLAPPGQHVASLFCQQFDYSIDWDRHRQSAAETIINQVETFAPGFRELILGMQILSPLDLERRFGLVRGDIFHGKLTLDQMFSARPVLGYGNYRSPIQSLYMCGSGTHPGGGVSGVPGHNAAHEILRDM